MPENYESHDAIYLVAHHEAMPPVGTYADTLTPGLSVHIAVDGQMSYRFKYTRFGLMCEEHLGFFREISLARAKEYLYERFLSGKMIRVKI